MELLQIIGTLFIDKVWPLLVFLIILSLIIFVHELGHYLAARWSGVKVEEFAIGFGPALFKRTKGGTNYCINAIPLGGFVQMLGEDNESKDPRSFSKAKLWKRMGITLAGVFMNFLTAWILLTILFTIGTQPFLVSKKNVQESFQQELLSFDTVEFGNITAKSSLGQQLITGWETGESPEELQNVEFKINYTKELKYPWYKSMGVAVTESFRISKATVERVAQLPGDIIRNKSLPDDIGGPVRIAYVTYEIIPQGIIPILKLVILISLSLAVMNLLPIPALDGGRFIFQLVEVILLPFKIKMNSKIENSIHIGGFILVLGLIILITWNDFLFIIDTNEWFGSFGSWMVRHLKI